MELYGKKSKSIPQKTVIVIFELLLLYGAYWILFEGGGTVLLEKVGISTSAGNYESRLIIFVFSIVIFLRITFMMVFFLKRKIPWEESISVPMAFALYFIGFSLFVYPRTTPIFWLDYVAIVLFLLGSYLNTYSEWQRNQWKKLPQNKGKLYTKGLFRYSMHINYFGDLLYISACALVTLNPYSVLIPAFLFCFFAFYNIPKLDAYLAEKYQPQFENYRQHTSKFIPFVY